MSATHSRANKGGQVGANGEWYEGGQFIATTDHAKGGAKKRSGGKVEVAPYKWEPARDGFRPLYDFVRMECGSKDGSVSFRQGLKDGWDSAEVVAQRIQHIAKWNSGVRWVAM